MKEYDRVADTGIDIIHLGVEDRDVLPWVRIGCLELNVVESVNCESRISHQPDGPIVRPLERPQLVDTIRTHGHKLYTEGLEILGELIELGQLRDTVRAPISTIKLQQKGRPSEIRKPEFLAIGVQPRKSGARASTATAGCWCGSPLVKVPSRNNEAGTMAIAPRM